MSTLLQKISHIFSAKRFLKKTLALGLFLGVGTIFCQQNIISIPQVHAQIVSTDDPVETELIQKTRTLNALLKIIYVLLWPLLALAGLTLDNGMIYGSYFHLDAPLWTFWNIMKNFANFTLGFLVLFSILKSIFAGWNKSSVAGKDGPLGVIQKSLVAGILIQMSWFLLAAVIDVSTVATYAVGGLPLSVLENSDELGSKPVLGVHSNLDLKNYEGNVSEYADSFEIWYSYADSDYISKCKIFEGQYIVGRLNGHQNYDNTTSAGGLQLCVHGGVLYAWDEHDNLIGQTEAEYATQLDNLWNSNRTDFTAVTPRSNVDCSSYGDPNFQDLAEMNTLISSISPIQSAGTIPANAINLSDCESKLLGKAQGAKRLLSRDASARMTINNMLTKLEGFTGPLVTMYATLMNFAEISNVPKEGENVGAMWLELLIKTLFALALIIPMAILSVVLLARIGMIWLMIAFMPFLILAWTFKWDNLFKENKVLGKLSSPGNMFGIIFAPVIVVFALSVAVIFMSALQNTLNSDAKQHQFFEELGIYEESTNEVKVGDIVTIEMNGTDTGTDFGNLLSFLSWLLTNLFAVGLVWAILFAAIKATSLGEDIAKAFDAERLLKDTLMNIPLFHVPGPDGKPVGIGAQSFLSQVPGVIGSHVDRWTQEENEALRDFLNPPRNASNGGPNAAEVMQYQAMVNAGVSASDAAQALGFTESQVTGSTAFAGMSADSAAVDQFLSNQGVNQIQLSNDPNELTQNDLGTMTKSQILNALNSGKIELAGDTGIAGLGGKHYVVKAIPRAFGGWRYELIDVPDTDGDGVDAADIQAVKDDIQAGTNDQLKAAQEEELALYQSNQQTIDNLVSSNSQLRQQNQAVFFAQLQQQQQQQQQNNDDNDDNT